jgi:hypothetical protein
MQPYVNPTRRNTEDNLNLLKMEDDLNFYKWKITLIFINGRQPQLIFLLHTTRKGMEDDLNFF